MTRTVHSLALRAAVALLVVVALSGTAAAENEVQMLTEYFDLLASGNYESASYRWLESCQDRSARFGITYTGIPLKLDCASPIVRDLDMMKNHLQPPVKKVRHLPDNGYTVLEYSTVVWGNLVSHDYYVYNDSAHCWLLYPQDYYCRDWPVYETKYFRLNVHPDMTEHLNDIAFSEADSFVESTAKFFGLSDDDLALLQKEKIEYFYCDTDYRIKDITGFLVKGTYDLPSGDIISAFFPHLHEITHMLVNFRLKELPLYTLPLLREGLAVHLGGRWGKAPASLQSLGGYLYKEKIVEVDSLLTMTNFEEQVGSGIAYPVAGLFTAYLMDRLGPEDFLRLYLDLSGDFKTLTAMSQTEIKKVILKAVAESDWHQFLTDFEKSVDRRLIDDANILPGGVATGETVLEADGVSVTEDGDWLSLRFESADDAAPAGNILFHRVPALAKVRSSLFEGQYQGGTSFDGYRFGIRVDRNEAGVYDYATNTLLAKYIWGISPSDEYYNTEKNSIIIRVNKAMFGTHQPNPDDYRLLPD